MPTQNQKRQRQKMGRQARQAALLAARRRRARRNRAIVAGFLALLLVLGVATLVGGGNDSQEVATDTTAPPSEVSLPPVPPGGTIDGDTPCPQADGSSPRTLKFAKPPPMCIDPNGRYTAEIKTNLGVVTATLDAKAAPKTVNNFVVLARYHYFDGISFHRIIPGFVIQGGDPELNGQGGPGYEFEDELPPAGQYKVGSLAMANSGPNTNGSQFFIVTGEQGAALPPQYSLFGQVTGGLDVVQKIDAAGSPNSQEGKPTQVVTMESVTIKEA
ncbi:MAG TPA: peptidylprolyl isomerase [Acidimicrobiales bacterium]|nr:peptidylprolyl isomerase [Acidimicrobiales bacterium]